MQIVLIKVAILLLSVLDFYFELRCRNINFRNTTICREMEGSSLDQKHSVLDLSDNNEITGMSSSAMASPSPLADY